MPTTTISGAGAHASAAATDRIPASKAGVKGYLLNSQIKDYIIGLANTWALEQTFTSGTTSGSTYKTTGNVWVDNASATAIFVGSLNTGLAQNTAGILESNSGGAIGTGGIVPGVRFATTQVVTTLANNNSAQNVFAAANDVLTLAASTTYFFECLYYLDTGATTHTTATGFVASSAFTSINYWAELWSTTAGTISTTAPSVLNVAASTATVLNATSTATRTTIRCSGIIRTNSASTVTPQITFSADPTGTCTVGVNSYFRIWPVGSNTVAAVGSWA